MPSFASLLSARAHTLRLPKSLREEVDRYVQTLSAAVPVERAPFRRRLDLWVYSIATALAEGLDPVDLERARRHGYKFADTRSVQMSADVCGLLAVVATAGLGPDHEGVADPAEIVEYGNRLAAAGCPVVVGKLRDPDLRLTALEKVRAHATSLLQRQGVGSGEASQ